MKPCVAITKTPLPFLPSANFRAEEKRERKPGDKKETNTFYPDDFDGASFSTAKRGWEFEGEGHV